MTRMSLFRAALACAAVAGPVAAGSLLLEVPTALAATVSGAATIAVPGTTAAGELRSGGSSTPFTLALPAYASCPADTAHHGYHVYSYLLPKGTDLSTVRFVDFPSEGYGLDSAGRYYGAVNTAEGTGQIIGIPNDFEWGPLVRSDGGSLPLSSLVGGANHGVWEAGIACATTHGVLSRYWNTQVTFTAGATAAQGFTWHAVPGGSAGSTPLPATPSGVAGGARTAPAPSAPAPAAGGSSGAAGRFASGERRPSGASGGTAGPAGASAPDRTGGSVTVNDVPTASAVCAGVLVLAVGLLLVLRRTARTGSASAARGSAP